MRWHVKECQDAGIQSGAELPVPRRGLGLLGQFCKKHGYWRRVIALSCLRPLLAYDPLKHFFLPPRFCPNIEL